jgi:putative inorganic carbon (hco3(-)) transporter
VSGRAPGILLPLTGGPRLPPLDRRTLGLGAAALAVGAAVALLPPVQAAALLAGAIVVPIALSRPLVALCLAVTAIPISSEWSVGVGGLNLTLMEPAVGLAVVAWLYQGARRRSLRIWPSGLLVAQLIVLILFILSAMGAEAPGPSLKDTLKWVELLLVFILATDLARNRSSARWLLLALVGAAALEALYGLVQLVTGRGPSFFVIGPFMRAYGHFAQPNPFAGYLGTALPLAAALALSAGNWWGVVTHAWGPPGRSAVARWGRLAGDVRAWAPPAAVLLAGGIVASLSRGAWLGIAIAGAIMLAVASPRSRRLLVPLAASLVVVSLLGSVGALPPIIAERVGLIAEYFGPFDVRGVELTPENWSVVERMAHWQAAWYMFLDHPWLGIGPGNYGALYDEYFLPGWIEPLGHAHNYYLNLAAETGLLGLAAYLLTLVLAFRAAARGLRAPDPFWQTVALGVLGSLVAVAIHSAFDNLYVHGVSVQIGGLFSLAILAATSAERADE